MDKNLFDRLTESMEQMGEIVRGELAPSREFHIDAITAEEVTPQNWVVAATTRKLIP